jgi:hypothetical protein
MNAKLPNLKTRLPANRFMGLHIALNNVLFDGTDTNPFCMVILWHNVDHLTMWKLHKTIHYNARIIISL